MSDTPHDILQPRRTEERIARRIARAGICSRREAEQLILEGLVTVNGELLESPAFTVTDRDMVTVRGVKLPSAEPVRLWRYYKPRGLVVSNKDDKGRETVFSALPANMPRVISVGRLDIDSEGLLLLTNDGALSRYMELPSTGWTRKYRVRVRGVVDADKLSTLEEGVTIDGIHYGSALAQLDTQMSSNAWLTVAIREGKNREVRHLMEYLGYPVSRLIRISYGPFPLGKLAEGEVAEVKSGVLAEQLGLSPQTLGTSNGPQRSGVRRPRSGAGGKSRTFAASGCPQKLGQRNRRSRPQNDKKR
ncbi:MAG: Ribosomal large subunit pseudouridine synthase B [Alphaproteobacteria bacterium UBA4588]|nr:MAG: Ribosomal large subunit pseudouridine synthase B [Alphaproteobacteria bacterium UBA4588]